MAFWVVSPWTYMTHMVGFDFSMCSRRKGQRGRDRTVAKGQGEHWQAQLHWRGGAESTQRRCSGVEGRQGICWNDFQQRRLGQRCGLNRSFLGENHRPERQRSVWTTEAPGKDCEQPGQRTGFDHQHRGFHFGAQLGSWLAFEKDRPCHQGDQQCNEPK